jgi:hypothetical protein
MSFDERKTGKEHDKYSKKIMESDSDSRLDLSSTLRKKMGFVDIKESPHKGSHTL